MEVENNPFVDIVISAEAENKNVFFGQEHLFPPKNGKSMFTISFDMFMSDLEKHYGKPKH